MVSATRLQARRYAPPATTRTGFKTILDRIAAPLLSGSPGPKRDATAVLWRVVSPRSCVRI
jgi:hypothetical protein